MLAETVAEILTEIVGEFTQFEILESFELTISALQNLAGSPSPAFQTEVNEQKISLLKALTSTKFNNYPIGLQLYIAEMEVGEILPPALAAEVERAFTGNDLTPAITLEKMLGIEKQAKRLVQEAASYINSSEYFEIYPQAPEGDEFEFSITIPRESVSNELDNFGRELVKLDKLLGVFSEIATGSRDDFKIKTISSSALNVVLESGPAVAVMIATALERISTLYERLLNIIQLHKEMKKNSLPDAMLKEMEKFLQKSFKDEIENAAKDIEDGLLRKIEATRRQELKTELRNTLKELANRYDRGYVFDVRGSPSGNEAEADEGEPAKGTPAWQRQIVASKRERLRYFKVEDKPILGLPEPEKDQDYLQPGE